MAVQGPPGTPTGLSATATGPTTIDLSWTLSSAKPREKGVRVYSSADGSTYTPLGADLSADSTSLSVDELVPGTLYYFKVSALGSRVESAPSDPASATTDSDTPPVAAFSLESTSVLTGSGVIATNLSTDYTSSAWYVDDVLVSTEDSPTLPFDAAGDHVVTLVVSGPGGTDTSDPQTVTVTDPATPTVTSVVGLSDRFEVNFDTTVTGHDGFEFHTATHDDIPATYSSGDGTNKLIFLRDSGTTYQGESYHLDYSPGNVQAVSGGATLGAFTGYAVDNQSVDQPPAPTLPTLVSLTIPVAGNTLVLVASEAVTGTAAPTLSVSGGAALATYLSGSGTDTITYSLSRTVLDPETATASMSGGLYDSDGHPLASFSGASVDNQSTATAAAPGQPTGLEARAIDTAVVLAWSLADAADTAVRVERSPGGAGTYATVGTAPGGTELFTDAGPLDPSADYDYRVTATNAAGDSSPASVSVTTAAGGYGVSASSTLTAEQRYTGLAIPALAAESLGPWRVRVSWTAPAVTFTSSTYGSVPAVVILRSSDGGATYSTVRYQGGSGDGEWEDFPLAPDAEYRYAAFWLTSNARGPVAFADAVTTDAQGSLPSVPTGLSKVEQSTTQTVLSWEDSNAGAATYEIWTAPVPGAGVPESATFTKVAETAAGATSYTLTTQARKAYYWRLRAKTGAGVSDYTGFDPDLVIRTPSGDAATTIDVGAGQAYADVPAAQAAINALGKGSTVNFHGGTYAAHLLVSCRGTAAEPITFNFLSGATIDGYQAVLPTTAEGYAPANGSTFWGIGGILLHRLSSDVSGYAPGHLVFRNATVKRASFDNAPNTFTGPDGLSKTYSSGASGFYVACGQDILLEDCSILENGNGVFGAASGGEVRDVADLTIRGCYFEGNGQANSSQRHGCYIEGRRTTYEHNWLGAPRPTMSGSQIKDRGTGTVVRYNRIDPPTGRPLDLVESQNNFGRAFADPDYHLAHAYGNLLRFNTSNPIHYGGDSATITHYRGSSGHRQLRFYANTVVVDPSLTPGVGATYRSHLFFNNHVTDAVDCRNNVWDVADAVQEAALFTDSTAVTRCVGRFGPNLVRADWLPTRASSSFTGLASGTGNFEAGTPTFVDESSVDYSILGGTAGAGSAGRLPSDWLPPDRQYLHPRDTEARTRYGVGGDLGAWDAAPDETAPTVTGSAIDSFGGTWTVTHSERVTSDGTGYALALSGGAITPTYAGGSGTPALTFSLSRVVLAGETDAGSAYDSGVGNTADLWETPNALASCAIPVNNGSGETSATGAGPRSTAAADPTGQVTTASFDRTELTGLANGDWVAVLLDNLTSTAVVTPPAGFSLRQLDGADYLASAAGRTRFYVKKITDAGSEPATYDFAFSVATYAMGVAVRLAGLDGTDPVDDTAKLSSPSGTTHTCPAMTTTVADAILLYFILTDRERDATVPPGTAEKAHYDVPLQYGGTVALAATAQSSPGDTGTKAWTISSARAAGLVGVALKPA